MPHPRHRTSRILELEDGIREPLAYQTREHYPRQTGSRVFPTALLIPRLTGCLWMPRPILKNRSGNRDTISDPKHFGFGAVWGLEPEPASGCAHLTFYPKRSKLEHHLLIGPWPRPKNNVQLSEATSQYLNVSIPRVLLGCDTFLRKPLILSAPDSVNDTRMYRNGRSRCEAEVTCIRAELEADTPCAWLNRPERVTISDRSTKIRKRE